ncbi:MAG: response regulator transcription factor [Thiomicrorhabdus sp.]|nr:response regulator transcription factor [Thiomicrorhabdus sp.]
MRVLLALTDQSLAVCIGERLRNEPYAIDVVTDAADAAYYVGIRHYELIISEWHIANDAVLLNGNDFNPQASSVFILSDSGDSQTEIAAFEQGANDYLTIPFDLDVLKARIDRDFKRRGLGQEHLKVSGLEINLAEHKVSYNDERVHLEGKPLEVLFYLMQHAGTIVAKEQLLEALWFEPELVTPNVIEVAIHRIRQEVDDKLAIATIETVRRRGYRFKLQDLADKASH